MAEVTAESSLKWRCLERRCPFARIMTATTILATTKMADAPVAKRAHCTLTKENPPESLWMLLVSDSRCISYAEAAILPEVGGFVTRSKHFKVSFFKRSDRLRTNSSTE